MAGNDMDGQADAAPHSNPPNGCGDPLTLVHTPASYVEPMDLARVFDVPQPIELELGSGDGGFILQWAALHPGLNFLAVERLKGRLTKIDRKGRRQGLTNLRALRVEAMYLLEYLLPRRSISSIHIYFPDPWPKRKHRKNRLINEHFVAVAATTLGSRGRVYLRTDDRNYFDQMTDVFGRNTLFAAIETPADLAAVQTDFELEFLARGISCLRAAYELQT